MGETGMTGRDEVVIERVREAFGEALWAVERFRGDLTLVVDPARIVDLGLFLRDEPDLAYDHLTFVTAVDYLEMGRDPRFAVVYQLTSLRHTHRLRVKAPVDGDPPRIASVTGVWPAADWHERETFDLMGVVFEGHPNLRRILLPDYWIGHPLRKDEPLGGEPVAFSANRDDPALRRLGDQVWEPEPLPAELPPGFDGERYMVLNMGPQHPATHGVLRLVVALDGERMVDVYPDIGHLHSGIEKTLEYKLYQQGVVYTDRMDYVAAMNNNLAYVLTVEKLLGITDEIPPRAQYLRVICAELQRLAAHLIWLGTSVLDVSGTIMSLLLYTFRDREEILNLFEMISGARLTPSYLCVGGVRWDVPPEFVPGVRCFLDALSYRLDEYERMLTRNPIFRSRVEGVGVLDPGTAIALGVTGPTLRGSGIAYDVRKVFPYSGYDQFEFEVPVQQAGDAYARYLVRMAEMRQSISIIRQAIDRLPDGPVKVADRKLSLPPREELDTSMEALIHHFKLVTEGFSPPPGEVYCAAENPKGELGFFIVSDGAPRPYRCKIRGPSFSNISAAPVMARGRLFSDMVAIIGSIDITLGEVDR